jgi:outer membrane murein-binding lipoprotein Lpp
MRTIAAVFAVALLAGCSSEPSGPTYAEAVATYQAEVALLDSLQVKLEALEAAHQKDISETRELCRGLVDKSEMDSSVKLLSSASQDYLTQVVETKGDRDDSRLSFDRMVASSQRLHNLKANEIKSEIELQRKRVESAKALRELLTK